MNFLHHKLVKQTRQLVHCAIEEDIADGDVTDKLVIQEHGLTFALRARSDGIFCGEKIANEVFRQASLDVFVESCTDGYQFKAGETLQLFKGSSQITVYERIILNIVQHLSAISSHTAQWVQALRGTSCRLVDTRKTTPGWRYLEKYAVHVGGGTNHRVGLFDAIMIKDNHLARAGNPQDEQLTAFVKKIVEQSQGLDVIIEVDTIEQFKNVLPAQPNIILLDNMTVDQLKVCVTLKQASASSQNILLEASGGITLGQAKCYAQTGVDRISTGALTQNPPRLDLGLDMIR